MKELKIGDKVETNSYYEGMAIGIGVKVPSFNGTIEGIEMPYNIAIVKLKNGRKRRINIDALQAWKV